MKPKKGTFVVELWSRVFGALRWVSVFQIIVALVKPTKGSWRFVDSWVMGNLFAAFLMALFASSIAADFFRYFVAMYAALRILEMVVYQINVAFFDEYRVVRAGERYAVRSFRRLTILALQNYAEAILWFAAIYGLLEDWFTTMHGAPASGFVLALGHSFNTMTTFGTSYLAPDHEPAYIVVLVQASVGVFMVVITLARILSLLPTPETLDEFENTSGTTE